MPAGSSSVLTGIELRRRFVPFLGGCLWAVSRVGRDWSDDLREGPRLPNEKGSMEKKVSAEKAGESSDASVSDAASYRAVSLVPRLAVVTEECHPSRGLSSASA